LAGSGDQAPTLHVSRVDCSLRICQDGRFRSTKNPLLKKAYHGLERSDTKISSTLGSMRVLGIDCGSEYTGFGVVEEMSDRTLVCHSTGAIKLKSGTPMSAKLQKIFADLTAIIAKHQPEIVAIEDVFYAVNVKTR
jgi:hypothetical protein